MNSLGVEREATLADGAALKIGWSTDDRRRDAELVQACLHGDQAAWDALVERYAGLVYTVASASGLPAPGADAVFQAVFTRLCDALPHLTDTLDLTYWLVTVTDQECRRLTRPT